MAPPTGRDSGGTVRLRHGVSHSALVGYLGGLRLAGGDHDGEAFTVLAWQRRLLRGAFGQADDSALSVGRGNGKSALVAGIAAAVVDPAGPLHGPQRHVICAAASFEQAVVVFRDTLGFLRSRGHDLGDRRVWRLQDSSNRAIAEHRPSGALIRCIGSDPATAHGLRPYLALLDEPAQWPSGTAAKMLAAVRTGLGKTPGSRLVALGTRPADSGHWFAKMLAGDAGYSQVHAARPHDPPGQRRTWRRANPSLDHLPSLEARIRAEYAAAKRNPSLMASFVALRLNGGTSDVAEAHLLEAGEWLAIEGVAPLEGPSVWGIDLGGSAAMSAVASFWPRSGCLLAVSAFPGEPDLVTRGVRDGVAGLYEQMARRGELVQTGGRAVDTAALLRLARDRFGQPSAVTADRWKADDLRDALKAAGVRPVPFTERGMGFRDGAQDTEAFRRSVAEARVIAAPSLLLRSAVGEARVVMDPAGNCKIAKSSEGGRRLRARDDAAVAAVLAVAEGMRREVRRPSRPLRSALAG